MTLQRWLLFLGPPRYYSSPEWTNQTFLDFPDIFALLEEMRWTEGYSIGCKLHPHQINPTHWTFKLKVHLLALWWSARSPLCAEIWSPSSKSWVQFQVNWSWINPAGTGRFLQIKTPGRVYWSWTNAWNVLQKRTSSERPLRAESRDPFYMTPSLLRLHGRLIVMPELFLASGEKNPRAEEKCMQTQRNTGTKHVIHCPALTWHWFEFGDGVVHFIRFKNFVSQLITV